MTTGQLIKEYRNKKGLTQEDLAAKTGISSRTIQRIENDEVDPRTYTLKLIADALEIDFDILNNSGSPLNNSIHSQEEKLWLPLIHLSALFLLLIPSFLIWSMVREKSPKINEHGKDVINFQLNLCMIMIPCGIFSFLIFPIFIVIGIGFYSLVISFLNIIRVLNDQDYHYRYWIHFLR